MRSYVRSRRQPAIFPTLLPPTPHHRWSSLIAMSLIITFYTDFSGKLTKEGSSGRWTENQVMGQETSPHCCHWLTVWPHFHSLCLCTVGVNAFDLSNRLEDIISPTLMSLTCSVTPGEAKSRIRLVCGSCVLPFVCLFYILPSSSENRTGTLNGVNRIVSFLHDLLSLSHITSHQKLQYLTNVLPWGN